jgi:hypothetical protein
MLLELAEQLGGRADGRTAPSKTGPDALARKIQTLDEQRAGLEDALKTTQADLARSQKQLEAEQARGAEFQGIIDDQRARLESLPKEISNLEAEVVAKNAEIHRLQTENEELLLRVQRAELALEDQSKVGALEQDKTRLSTEAGELRGQLDELRAEKDRQIAQLEDDLREARSAAAGGGQTVLTDLWKRLEITSPPLAEAETEPDAKAAERLVDSFIELLRFVDDIDKGMRPFIGRFTADHASVKVPWDAFAKGDDFYTIAQRTIVPKVGRPVGVLKMRLRLLYSWIHASVLGCDSAVESVASELHSHLRGTEGGEWDFFKSAISKYDRADGPEKFQEIVRRVRSEKLAEAFGRGG